MPDLTLEGALKFWSQYQDPVIPRVVAFMESVETWPLDGDPTVEEALNKLSKELESISDLDFSKLGQEMLLIHIACSLKMSRALRFLHIIDTAHPGTASRLFTHAEQLTQRMDDPPGLLLRRNVVFERLRLLARVFSQERFALVLKALEGEEYE
jgi:intracellular multiplication protein IcmW